MNPEPAVEPLELSWAFEPPVADATLLLAAMEELMERLLKELRSQPVGCEEAVVVGEDRPGRTGRASRSSLVRPTTVQKDLMELIRLQVERAANRRRGHGSDGPGGGRAPLVFGQLDLFGGGSGNRGRTWPAFWSD